jgi:hypothetical protein
MARAIALGPDFSAAELRRLVRCSKDAAQARRLLALAAIYDGGARSEAARLGNVTLQIDRGPIPAVHGVVCWHLCDLGQ